MNHVQRAWVPSIWLFIAYCNHIPQWYSSQTYGKIIMLFTLWGSHCGDLKAAFIGKQMVSDVSDRDRKRLVAWLTTVGWNSYGYTFLKRFGYHGAWQRASTMYSILSKAFSTLSYHIDKLSQTLHGLYRIAGLANYMEWRKWKSTRTYNISMTIYTAKAVWLFWQRMGD